MLVRMLQKIKLKQIMIRISIWLVIGVMLGCANSELHNEYIFTEPTAEWCVIVNGCQNGDDFVEGHSRRFVFPESGILLADIENFKITEDDRFFMNGKSFDPNSKDPESYKLCYYTASINTGYNADYLSKKYGVSLADEVEADQNFDLYFFRVEKSCNRQAEGLDKYFDKIWLHLLKNKVTSAK